jgi:hypothetical protein
VLLEGYEKYVKHKCFSWQEEAALAYSSSELFFVMHIYSPKNQFIGNLVTKLILAKLPY